LAVAVAAWCIGAFSSCLGTEFNWLASRPWRW
jgi:hypothetical protein